MLKVKHFSPDLTINVVKGDLKPCFKVCSIRSQCNVEMKRLIFIKFGHGDVAFICYKCFVFHILFLTDDLIETLRVHCKGAKVSNDSCIQSFKKHYIDYQDLCYGCVSNCYHYMLEMFYLLLV